MHRSRGRLEQHKQNLRTWRGEFAAPPELFAFHEEQPDVLTQILAENKSFHREGTRSNSGIMQLHFLELLIPSEEYLEFLISSTCLGVNAKMHGLS